MTSPPGRSKPRALGKPAGCTSGTSNEPILDFVQVEDIEGAVSKVESAGREDHAARHRDPGCGADRDDPRHRRKPDRSLDAGWCMSPVRHSLLFLPGSFRGCAIRRHSLFPLLPFPEAPDIFDRFKQEPPEYPGLKVTQTGCISR